MKIFVAILGLSIVGILADTTEKDNTNWEANKNACIKEVGIDPDALEKSFKGALDKNDEKLGCFLACISKKMGLMNADGSINESRLRVRGGVGKERAVMMRNKCKVMKGDNDCETALKVANCMHEEDNLL
ncbi:general odorant-binding protein 56a-like [Belonocnema kinseyi]|uniref:general odorant-binding protein 56a-like n=1 Tax=Belonocnema kinseyi TaxID=2817044 RepID=UPI00143DA0A3|nr:general odorant-binding protein 56a-like [Belonocnema kinseyi]